MDLLFFLSNSRKSWKDLQESLPAGEILHMVTFTTISTVPRVLKPHSEAVTIHRTSMESGVIDLVKTHIDYVCRIVC